MTRIQFTIWSGLPGPDSFPCPYLDTRPSFMTTLLHLTVLFPPRSLRAFQEQRQSQL